MIDRITQFSPCRDYRYTLWREWDAANTTYCQFIGLNPSTADETKDDPTIRRCIAFAKALGYGALCMTNLFAWRDTLPAKMKKAKEPIGPENDRYLIEVGKSAGVIVAAWGLDGRHFYRGMKVQQMFRGEGLTIYCLRLTKVGYPEHPFYLPKSLRPISFNL